MGGGDEEKPCTTPTQQQQHTRLDGDLLGNEAAAANCNERADRMAKHAANANAKHVLGKGRG